MDRQCVASPAGALIVGSANTTAIVIRALLNRGLTGDELTGLNDLHVSTRAQRRRMCIMCLVDNVIWAARWTTSPFVVHELRAELAPSHSPSRRSKVSKSILGYKREWWRANIY